MLAGIDQIDIAVDALDKWSAFLELIGSKVIRRASHGGGSVEISFPGVDKPFPELTSTQQPNGPAQPASFRHIVLRPENIDETFAALSAKGIAIDRPPRQNAQSGRKTMNAIDPAGGMTIQIVE